MPNAKEIKNHILSVQETRKITNAMYLIASTKMKKAKSELDKTQPYFLALKAEIKRIFRKEKEVESKYFYPVDGSELLANGAYACLVITADKGLAGAYNQNVIKEARKLLDEHKNTKLFVVGEYGRHYFTQHNYKIEHSFLYTAQNPTIQRAREITNILLDLYDKGEVTKIFVVYTDFKSRMKEDAITYRLLPFHRKQFVDTDEKELKEQFDFEPSITAVLDTIVPSYIIGYIYSALIDSFCSEQSARMSAMDSANENAEKILSELSIEYNRVRQGTITQEITEISSGAKAQKNKR